MKFKTRCNFYINNLAINDFTRNIVANRIFANQVLYQIINFYKRVYSEQWNSTKELAFNIKFFYIHFFYGLLCNM